MLSCVEVRKNFDGHAVLRGVSLGVARGEILGVAGPNGAGKTVLLDVICGFLSLDGGTITLDDREIERLPAWDRTHLGLGRTFQSTIVPDSFSVGELFSVALSCSGRRQAAIGDVRGAARLEAQDDAPCVSLGIMERRKLLLACVALQGPSFFLLDEPTSGLLEAEIDEMREILRTLMELTDAGTIVVEHRLEFLTSVAERVVVLDQGRELAVGTPEDVFQRAVVREAYFGKERGN